MTLGPEVELHFQLLPKGARQSSAKAKGELPVPVELLAFLVAQFVVGHPVEEVPPQWVSVAALPQAAPEREILAEKAVAQITLVLLEAPSVYPHPRESWPCSSRMAHGMMSSNAGLISYLRIEGSGFPAPPRYHLEVI